MIDTDAERKNPGLITEELFREAYLYQDVRRPPLRKILANSLKFSKNTFLNLFPITKWLPKYSFKKNLLSDIIAGITVAIMHVPHGLAYAPLGGVAPVVGFYMAIFPVFIYMIMGTSRHISIGTFAVVCAMVGESVGNVILQSSLSLNHDLKFGNETEFGQEFKPIEVGAAICLMVGIWQVILGLLKMGFITVLMSESMVSGFTTGAAFHVFSYQLKNLFGVHINSYTGIFKLGYIYADFIGKIGTVNLITMSVSAGCIAVLLFCNLYLKNLLLRKFPKNKFPIPIELIVVVLGILISYYGNLSENYDVRIVGFLPEGFPIPKAPPVEILPHIIIDSLIVAVVAVAINVSMAKIFAKKDDYEVSSNQELLAYGASNVFSAFFLCLPSAASLSRSSLQFSVGGKTQLASFFSIILITFILLVAGSLFEPVPYCVLSSIVIVSLKSLLMQVFTLPRIWRQSYLDGIVWLGTFLAVVVLDLDLGLGVGILLSLLTMIIFTERIRIVVLGRVPNTNVFLDLDRYKAAQAVPGVLILHITGNINFANVSSFENGILREYKTFSATSTEDKCYVVLNMAAVAQIDPAGVTALTHIHKHLEKHLSDLYLTDCNVSVYETLGACKFFEIVPKDRVVATVSDVIEYLGSIT